MCAFQSLYFDDDGYVVRCKQCGLYQLAFMCIVIAVTQEDYGAFCRIVKRKCTEADSSFSEHSKCIIIQTPAEGICFLLTKKKQKDSLKCWNKPKMRLKHYACSVCLIHRY